MMVLVFMLTVGSSDVFNYYAEWKIREDKREKTEKFEENEKELSKFNT